MKIKLWQWEYDFDKEDAQIVVPLALLLLGQKWLGFSLQRFGSVRWIACRLIRTFCCWRGGAQGGRSPTGAAPRQQQFSHTATLCGRWSR